MIGNTNRIIDVLIIATCAWGLFVAGSDDTRALDDITRFQIAQTCVVMLIVFQSFGLYSANGHASLARVIQKCACAWLSVAALDAALLFAEHRIALQPWYRFVEVVLANGALLLAARFVCWVIERCIRAKVLTRRKIIVVGAHGYGRVVLEQLRSSAGAGFEAIAVFDDEALVERTGESIGGVPVISDFHVLTRKVRAREVDEIWLALPFSRERTIQRIVREYRNDFVNVRYLPDVRSIALFNRSATDMLGMPTINLATNPHSNSQLWTKAVFDRVFALAAIVTLAPLLIALGIAVKSSSPGPVLFRQMRKGIDGQLFAIYKFRTMRVHADDRGSVRQASRGDPRVTKIGSMLRRTSLDELPQFFNVLLGQMSVVGPRPHAVEHDDFYMNQVEGYMYRYRVRPGITGWAQVNGYRGETRKVEFMEARVQFDLFYIQNWTFSFDMKIVLATLIRGFVGKNAF